MGKTVFTYLYMYTIYLMVVFVIAGTSCSTGTLADLTRLPMSIAAFGNGSTASISDMLKIATNVTNLQVGHALRNGKVTHICPVGSEEAAHASALYPCYDLTGPD